jgi:hypothetical protein
VDGGRAGVGVWSFGKHRSWGSETALQAAELLLVGRKQQYIQRHESSWGSEAAVYTAVR